MLLVFILLLITGVILAFQSNRDYFSPVKFYFLFLLVYFFDIFLNDQIIEVYFIYSIFLILGIYFAIWEGYLVKKQNIKFLKPLDKPFLLNPQSATKLIWLLSLIPVGVQFYLFSLDGGVANYINNIGLRVDNWKGMGHILIFQRIFPILNLIYLILGVSFSFKKKRRWWLFYIGHTLILILLGLLSGSRGATLNIFVIILIILHYFLANIRILKIITYVFLILGSAVILSQVRNSVKANSNELQLFGEKNIKEVNFEPDFIRYGIIPLDLIYKRDFNDFQYGLTFITVFTNFVPRKIWTAKPDTGGLVLTKFYSGIEYSKFSNFSTGLFVESIINFGYLFGVIIAIMLFFFTGHFVIKKYLHFRNQLMIHKEIVSIGYFNPHIIKVTFIYITFQRAIGNSLAGEFTSLYFTIAQDLILFYLIFYILRKYSFSKYKISPYKYVQSQ